MISLVYLLAGAASLWLSRRRLGRLTRIAAAVAAVCYLAGLTLSWWVLELTWLIPVLNPLVAAVLGLVAYTRASPRQQQPGTQRALWGLAPGFLLVAAAFLAVGETGGPAPRFGSSMSYVATDFAIAFLAYPGWPLTAPALVVLAVLAALAWFSLRRSPHPLVVAFVVGSVLAFELAVLGGYLTNRLGEFGSDFPLLTGATFVALACSLLLLAGAVKQGAVSLPDEPTDVGH